MAMCLVISDWGPQYWADEMQRLAGERDIRSWPETGDPSDIEYALVWKPPAGVLAGFPGLKVIFSLGAGVDHVFADPKLPANVPVVRIVDPDLTVRMSEYVVLHVLMHHRKQRAYDAHQRERRWEELSQPAAPEVRVGVMGLGVLGADAAGKLRELGFQVAGWSRTAKQIEGIESFSGPDGLKPFLARTDILVCLLPHTPDTEGLIDADLIAGLARDGALDGPVLINAGRGKVHVEADLVEALQTGALHGASLDVFETEPLPADSPLWDHPRVIITPHNASVSAPHALCRLIWDQIQRFEAGEPLDNVVDPQRGY